jgi:hypothetical protein
MSIWQEDTIKYADQDLRDADMAALGHDRQMAVACLASAMHRIEHQLADSMSLVDVRKAVYLVRRAADAADADDWGAAHLSIVDARHTLAAIR